MFSYLKLPALKGRGVAIFTMMGVGFESTINDKFVYDVFNMYFTDDQSKFGNIWTLECI